MFGNKEKPSGMTKLMQEAILLMVESIKDDITCSRDAEENSARANAVLTLVKAYNMLAKKWR